MLLYWDIRNNILTVWTAAGGLAISNKTAPLSRSRILKRVKSISYTFASGEQRYPEKNILKYNIRVYLNKKQLCLEFKKAHIFDVNNLI